MELEILLNDPIRRRCWLLSKALEIGSLQDAMRLAQEADAFVLQGRGDKFAGSAPDKRDGPPTADPKRTGASPFAFTSGEILTHRAEPSGGQAHSALHGKFAEDANGTTVTYFGNDDGAEAHANDGPVAPSGDTDLAVLAGSEDIVRYLRQRDDVVVPENGFFLVNGRFRLSPGELLARANKMRARQGMPLFERMPLGFPQERRLAASATATATAAE